MRRGSCSMIRYQSGKVWREKLRASETEKNLGVKVKKKKKKKKKKKSKKKKKEGADLSFARNIQSSLSAIVR